MTDKECMRDQSRRFWAGFFAGMAAPVDLFRVPHHGHGQYSVPQSFAEVGMRVNAASKGVAAEIERRNERQGL